MASSTVVNGLRLVARSESRAALLVALNTWAAGVRSASGCAKVTLVEQIDNPDIIYTVVEWENEQALEAFRNSPSAKSLAHPLFALLSEKVQTTRFSAEEIESEELFSV
jgi:quinol monooxygenase YgiN